MTLLQKIGHVLAVIAFGATIYIGLVLVHALASSSLAERCAGAGISLPAPATTKEK